ncbi:MAG: hypothetical protein K2L01_07975, partial [Rikenellaceae bacterium]|nr:hypothetical protein [Rikenellaceae bacterium]
QRPERQRGQQNPSPSKPQHQLLTPSTRPFRAKKSHKTFAITNYTLNFAPVLEMKRAPKCANFRAKRQFHEIFLGIKKHKF